MKKNICPICGLHPYKKGQINSKIVMRCWFGHVWGYNLKSHQGVSHAK